jgi:hypothetical protein
MLVEVFVVVQVIVEVFDLVGVGGCCRMGVGGFWGVEG